MQGVFEEKLLSAPRVIVSCRTAQSLLTMTTLLHSFLLIHFASIHIVSGMKLSDVHSGAIVRCMNLKPQGDPLKQSLVEKVNNSFAVVMCPPFNRDKVRVRLHWIGDPSVRVGIKAKYLSSVPKIIIHGTPHEEFLIPAPMVDVKSKEDMDWSNPFRYLNAKWKGDPTNYAKYGESDLSQDDASFARQKILRIVNLNDIGRDLYLHLFTYWSQYPNNDQTMGRLFDDWVNETFAEDSEFTRNLMKHCVQFIYHDHSTPAVKALRTFTYVEDDVMRIQQNVVAHSEHPRYDELHPRLTIHYFKSESDLLRRGDKLWKDLLDDPHCIVLVQTLAAMAYAHAEHLHEFNVIFPQQLSREAEILQVRNLKKYIESIVQRPPGSPGTERITIKKELEAYLAWIFVSVRPEVTESASNVLRTRVKSKMRKTIALIPKVAHNVWEMVKEAESGDSLSTTNQKLVSVFMLVKELVGKEMKLKIPDERTESKQYFQLWIEFAKCMEAELHVNHIWTILPPPEYEKIQTRLSGKGFCRMHFETILYWKAIDLRLDPNCEVHVIVTADLRNERFNKSEEQERLQFDDLCHAMGCSELVDERLISWNYNYIE